MRVLFLTHRLPYAPNRGDRARAHHLLRQLSKHFEVHLASLVHSENEATHADDVLQWAASVTIGRVPWLSTHARAVCALPTATPLTHILLDAPRLTADLDRLAREQPPDVVLAFCTSMARFAMSPPLDRFPFVLDMVDVDSAKWEALGHTSRVPARWIYRREATRLSAFELEAARRAVLTTVVSERERRLLRERHPEIDALVVPNGVDDEQLRSARAPAVDPIVLFAGVLNYTPNVDGVQWLAHDIWPRVRGVIPSAQLHIVGADPVRAVQQLANEKLGIRVFGSVPDMRPFRSNAAIAVAPLRVARGVQTKALEAVAAGLPVVMTKVVADGLPPAFVDACQIADDAATFASSVIELLKLTPEQRRAIATRVALGPYSWSAAASPLITALRQAARPPRDPRAIPASA